MRASTPHAARIALPGTSENTAMATTITMSRNEVPQRTWSVVYRCITSVSSGRPRSNAWIVLCSAPW